MATHRFDHRGAGRDMTVGDWVWIEATPGWYGRIVALDRDAGRATVDRVDFGTTITQDVYPVAQLAYAGEQEPDQRALWRMP